MNRDFRGSGIDVAQILGREFDGDGPDVFIQAMQLRSAGDRNNPGFPREQPCKRSLRRSRLLLCGDVAEQFDQGLIRFSRLRGETRVDVAQVGTVKRRMFVNLSGEKTSAQRAERNEADAEFFKHRKHFGFRRTPPQRVFALHCGDRLNCMCAAYRLDACFRKTEVFYLPFLNQVLYRSRHVFDWHFAINTVLIEQIDGFGLEAFERSLGDLLDVLRPAIEAALATGLDVKSEFRSDHHLLAERSEGFTDEFFIREGTVDFGSVEKGNTPFDGLSN